MLKHWSLKPLGAGTNSYPNAGVSIETEDKTVRCWTAHNPLDGGGPTCSYRAFLNGKFHAEIRDSLGEETLQEIIAHVQLLIQTKH